MERWLSDTAGRDVWMEIDASAVRRPAELPPCPWVFPDARRADDHGLIGEGADFAPSTIVSAYRGGIFPWPNEISEYLWFSPNPRAVIPLGGLRVTTRLARTIRAAKFRVTVDAAFEDVMRACATHRDGGTWITEALIEGYVALHEAGWAHSVEIWTGDGRLAGGLYGVGVGAMFGAESMFHRERDASKVALAGLVQHARTIGIRLIDIQVLTPHTASLGAIEISRNEYLARLRAAVAERVDWRG